MRRPQQEERGYSAAALQAGGRSKGRSPEREGTRARASATRAVSIPAVTMPGSSPPSASTSPQGATISEWP